jgi:hypothetical protein
MLKPNKLAITYQKQNELISQKNSAGHCTNVRGPQRASRQIVHTWMMPRWPNRYLNRSTNKGHRPQYEFSTETLHGYMDHVYVFPKLILDFINLKNTIFNIFKQIAHWCVHQIRVRTESSVLSKKDLVGARRERT